jgi:hypothetical protein
MKRLILLIIAFFMFLSPLTIFADLNDGLVAYYPFNGDAKDYSGNGYDGAEHGEIIYVDGVIDKAVKFSKFKDLLELPNTILNNTVTLTVSFWIKLDKHNIRAGILSASGYTYDNEYLIFLSSGFKNIPTSHNGLL